MKFKLSKRQWEGMGKKAGWMEEGIDQSTIIDKIASKIDSEAFVELVKRVGNRNPSFISELANEYFETKASFDRQISPMRKEYPMS